MRSSGAGAKARAAAVSGWARLHDVFISYSTTDKQVADAACASLEAQGVRCWIAPRDILGGDDFADAVVAAISQARVFVLIFSSHSNASEHVRREVQAAFHRGAVVVPLRIEDIEPSGALEYYLSGRHWLDAMTPPLEAQLKRLADNVKAVLSATPASERSLEQDRGASSLPRLRSTSVDAGWRRWALWVGGPLGALALGAMLYLVAQRLSTPVVDPLRRQTCESYLNQSAAMQARSAKVALEDNSARAGAILALLQSGRTGQSIYYVALSTPATPVGDYAAVSHFWEDFSECVSEKTLDFERVSNVVSFPDDFWNSTRNLRLLFGANWHGLGKGIPDFMSQFRNLCQAYKNGRASDPQAVALDCTQ